MLRVRKAMQRANHELHFVEPKSPQSRRVVDLPTALVEQLRAHRERQQEERLAAQDRWREHDLVFCTRWGTPLDGPNVTRYFQRLLANAGLPKLKFHGLRHSCASLLAAHGILAYEVARLLGHSDIRLTLNTYTHQFAEARRRTADAMEGLFTRE
jgi:integrase